jgi:hypothetical protein
MRCSYYPQSLVRIRGANRRSGVGFEGVDPRALFIPSCPDVTGLTGASPWWVLSQGAAVFVWFCPVVLLFSS